MTFRPTFKKHDRVRLDDARRGHYVRPCGDGHNVVVDLDGEGLQSVALSTVHHCPVLVVGGKPAPLPTQCPAGHPLGAAQDCEQYDPATRKHIDVRVVACGFCEFVHVVKK